MEDESSKCQDPERPLTITDLPDEVLMKIFDDVPKTDVFMNVCFVCKRWHCLAQDRSLRWTNIDVGAETSMTTLDKWIRAAPFLKHIVLQGRSDLDDILKMLIRRSKRLNSMHVWECQRFSSRGLCRIFRNCHNFHSFRFRNSRFRYDSNFFKVLMQSVKKNRGWSYSGHITYRQFKMFLRHSAYTQEKKVELRNNFFLNNKVMLSYSKSEMKLNISCD